MLTMSHAINASDRGGGVGWKTESYRSSDSVESSEDSDNSSTNSSLNGSRMNSNAPHLPPSPIGCITTHCVSAVIRPERKMPPIDPLQFVKIQKHELSKKAVEQIKLAEEVKITKEKIKEVEEEWQNNLMNWKSKRKLTKTNSEDEALPRNPNRKTKTFSEILNEKARLGARIGYNLHKYIGPEMEDDGDDLQTKDVLYDSSEPEKSDSNSENETTIHSNVDINGNSNSNDNNHNNNGEMNAVRQSNLDRFLNTTTINQNSNNNLAVDVDGGENISRNGLGEVVVYNTSLLEEFSVKADNCDNNNFNNDNNSRPCEKSMIDAVNKNITGSNPAATMARSNNESPQKKVHVPINDWKSSQQNVSRKQSTSTDDDQLPQNSSFENDDEEELDEELEKLRIDQERSFKAKLQTFEILAKQEEEAAQRAAEANRRRMQNRAKLAAERSKSLSNINSQPKHVLGSSNSISSSSLQQNKESDRGVNKNNRKQPTSMVINNEADEDSYYQLFKNAQTNSVVYNFKDKSENSVPEPHQTVASKLQAQQQLKQQPVQKQQQQKIPILKSSTTTINDNNEQITKTDNSQQPQQQQQQQITAMRATPTNNIYENVTSMTAEAPITTATLQTKTFPSTATIHHQQQQSSSPSATASALSPSEIISDSDAIRNASQKLLQQQQQIYQNQPLIQPIQPQKFVGQQQYPNDNYSNLPPINYGYPPEMLDDNQMMNSGHRGGGYQISDDVGLPPVQITKSIQSIQSPEDQQPVYQNQMMVNPHAYHNYDHSYNPPGTIIMPRREELVGSAYYSQPPPPSEPFQQPQSHLSPNMDQYLNSQYLYYPKPYGGVKNGPNDVVPVPKPILAKQQQPTNIHNPARIVAQNPNRYGSNGYNPNHWVIQEAELRQSAQRQLQQQQQQQVLNPIPPASANKNGYLSVSGKKKCSKCSEELGKGCAAMVVESLSLYYHINCFRCSVCNIQLGNGTVGTDVRVRNQKLHCQNCYSNDEAGLKFSRV